MHSSSSEVSQLSSSSTSIDQADIQSSISPRTSSPLSPKMEWRTWSCSTETRSRCWSGPPSLLSRVSDCEYRQLPSSRVRKLISSVIPITQSMKEPKKFPGVLSGVMLVVAILFGGAGAVGYMAYGSDIQTVVLVNLPQDDKFVQAVQFLCTSAQYPCAKEADRQTLSLSCSPYPCSSSQQSGLWRMAYSSDRAKTTPGSNGKRTSSEPQQFFSARYFLGCLPPNLTSLCPSSALLHGKLPPLLLLLKGPS